MQTSAERFDTTSASRAKFEPAAVTLQDHGMWPGLMLEQWESAGGELPETVLFQHGVMLNLETLSSTHIHWSGHRPVTGHFAPGSFGIFPAGLPYSGHSRGRSRALVLGIAPGFLRSVFSAAGSGSGSGSGAVELIPGNGFVDGLVWQAAQALANDVREGYPCGPLYGESISLALAAHLRKRYAADPRLRTENPGVADVRRQRIRQYILEQLHERLALADMAAFVGLDVYSFARWFKRAFGMPPHQYVLAARIERARSLLRGSRVSLVEIALQCGFSSQSHLASTFRRVVDVAPGAYRAGGG